MAVMPQDDGLRIVSDAADPDDAESYDDGLDVSTDGRVDPDLEMLRDEFVDGFNARDLEALLGIVHPDVECPDLVGDGASVLAEEIESIWERSPGAILTRAHLESGPCAVAWLPDEDGCWSRAALVCFDAEASLLTLVALPDDADALDRAESTEPSNDELAEWSDWAEWERGEETVAQPRDRLRP